MGVFCERLKICSKEVICSTAAPNCRTGQNNGRYREQELSFLLVLMVVGIICLSEIRINCLVKIVGSSHPVPSICSDGSETSAGGAPYDVNGGYFVNAPDLN